MAHLTLDWLHVITLLGAIQGLFLAATLATRRNNRTAHLLLAAATLAFSVHLATTVYQAAGLVSVYPHFFGAAYPLPFLYGPLIYLYAVTAADKQRGFARADMLHFLPFVAAVLVGLPTYLMSGPEKVAFFNQLERGDCPPWIRIVDVLKLVSGVTYAIVTLVFLRRHRERVKASYSSTERVNLRWLLWLGAIGAGIWAMAFVFQVLQSSGIAEIPHGDDYIALGIAVAVYAIGYMGLRQPEIHRYETAEHPIPAALVAQARQAEETEPIAAAELAAETEPIADAEPATTAARYERSGLTTRQAERLRDLLLAVMDRERPWQNSELTLADLASLLKTTPHKLSEVLNSGIGQTFYDFVNGYRVREIQRRIEARDTRQATMLTLAMDAGFASKSTFNDVFKKYTGQTPSDFRHAVGA